MFKNNLLFVDGKNILYICLAIISLGFLISYHISFIGFIFLVFCLYFFRNPERLHNLSIADNNIAISPSDGIVVYIKELETNIYNHQFNKKIAIFLSPLDVHVNWAPISGQILKVQHTPGKFLFAFVEKSSELNERNDLLIEDDSHRKMLIRQIAGTVARKIVCWKSEGDFIKMGTKYGMIKFGSRVEVFVDKNFEFKVSPGQRVYGGKTILGKWIC